MSAGAATRELRIGIIGAGAMAGSHSTALANLPLLYPDLPLRPRLVAVADVNPKLARTLVDRYHWERVEADAAAVIGAADVDLVVVCLPPAFNRDVVVAAAAAGKHIVCEKPLAPTAEEAAVMLRACRAAGVFHGLGAGYRWSPSVRAIGRLIQDGELGTIRSIRVSFMLDYAADPAVPLVWRFNKRLAGGGIGIDTGYHLVDLARFLVGEIESIQAVSQVFIAERPLPDADAVGNRGSGGTSVREMGLVDAEDAAAALLTFAGGAYGVLETSRVAIGRRVSLQVEVYGSKGSADWDLERPDEFHVSLAGDESDRVRRALENPGYSGARQLVVSGPDGPGLGWLGQQCAMWAEFLTAIAEGRPGSADFTDGVRDSAVLDALYAAAESGNRTPVVLPDGI